MTAATPLPPGSVIGVLGGGQLGRMLATAASQLGFDVHVFDPQPDCPASRVAARSYAAPYEDEGAVGNFAAKCDVVTFEFENVPLKALEIAAQAAPVRPGAKSLKLTQDRLVEKRFINGVGARTVDFLPVDLFGDLALGIERIGLPALLKTRRFGYDGKGQAWIKSCEDERAASDAIAEQPAILEAKADFKHEISVVAARGLNGEFAAYPVSENVHGDGILQESRAPAGGRAETDMLALEIARAIGDGLEHVGVYAVEMFELAHGELLVNEIAPRVHNTGHWTMDACPCSQFEQHIRAVAGWPLGPTDPHSAAVMTNLIGADAHDWAEIAADPAARLHLYGKREARDGRKMGHVTRLKPL
jgi:5-(carboxyamino)imidazole ribonucleotide synthase